MSFFYKSYIMVDTIGITFDLKADYKPNIGDPEDINAEFDSEGTIDNLAKTIESLGYKVKKIGNINRVISSLNNLGVDLVFNICEGTKGRNRESQVPMLLELKDIPFVGADALTLGLTLDKYLTKKILVAEGIPTPKFFQAEDLTSVDNQIKGMNFPMIVKPRFEGSSKGLTDSARVTSIDELKKRIRHVNINYKQAAIVEEFISGKEATVGIIGNKHKAQALPVSQIKIDGQSNLKDKFYTHDYLKYKKDNVEYVFDNDFSKVLNETMQRYALLTYNAVECRDFGRVDFRIDENNNPFVLEINPLPSLSCEDVFVLVSEYMGLTFSDTIAKIIEAAKERYGLKKEQLVAKTGNS
ncbi:MAG: ATP-grasp domain-containing protein [Candidatus Omnitrophota bacterium]